MFATKILKKHFLLLIAIEILGIYITKFVTIQLPAGK
jgi:hypothetical protein